MSIARENADGARLDAPLASPAFTGSPSITLGSDATGDVYYRAAGGALTRLATGADGTVLTSTGAAAVPAFEAIPSSEAFASGVKMIFNQTAAPTGWTKVTGSGNDHALRLTTGTVSTGGSVAFETAFASHTGAAHTLTTAEMPAHTHAGQGSGDYEANTGFQFSGTSRTKPQGGSTGGGGSHTHGSIDLNVSFVDVIIATKD